MITRTSYFVSLCGVVVVRFEMKLSCLNTAFLYADCLID